MKINPYLLIVGMFLLISCISCKEEVEINPKSSVVLETDFNQGANGWAAVYAEYPKDDSLFYELNYGIQPLPSPLDQTKKGFMLSGNNHSDALQMFLSRQLSGLDPNTNYTVETEVELASQYPSGSVGIGGSPGNAVHLVAKYATLGYTMQRNSESENIQLLLNKAGSFLELELGDISIPAEEFMYQLINRKKSSSPQVVKTDQNGKLWAVIGTWSGFEGITTLYYTKIKITLTKV